MAAQPSSSGTTPTPEAPRATSAAGHGNRLTGRRLALARGAWAVAAAALVALYLLLLPACLAQLRTVCSGMGCAVVQPTLESARALRMLGISLDGYAAVTFALILGSSLACFAVGGVIVWRRSSDWMALLVALALVALGTELVPYLLETGNSPWRLPALVTTSLDFAVVFLVFALFPTGRFAPRWAAWLVVAWVAACAAFIVSYVVAGAVLVTASALVWLAVFIGVAGGQVYRYRAVSGPAERAQTRWVVFGGVAALAIVTADFMPTFLFPTVGRPGSLYFLLSAPVYTLPLVLFSVCVGMAILRDRLYDIDVIIRRTLIYSVVTGALAATYAGCILAAQAVAQAIMGGGRQPLNPAVVAASTLLVAALFRPLRRRVQAAVDRRFYRRRYDAARTVAAFGATPRTELDPAQLGDTVLAAVREALQPERASLWLVWPTRLSGEGEPGAGQRPYAAKTEQVKTSLPPTPVRQGGSPAGPDGPHE